MGIMADVSAEATAGMLARLNEVDHFFFARVIESAQQLKGSDAPVGA